MAFTHNKHQSFDFEESSVILSKGEKTLKNKIEQVEQAQYELDLIKMDVWSKYKYHVTYDFSFFPNVLEQAWKWRCMLDKNKDKDGKPIDKRKKYDEKEKYNWLFDELKKQFNKDDIKINEILQYYWGQAYNIYFSTSGHRFQLTVPVVKNVTLDSYLNYGSEVFKLKLHYEKIDSVFEWVGSTFEEEKLKDILDKWLEENK